MSELLEISGRSGSAFGRSFLLAVVGWPFTEVRKHQEAEVPESIEVQMIVPAQPRPTGHPGYSETVPGCAESAEAARRLVTTALAAWRLEELTDAGTLLVSELVSNAVKHTGSRRIRIVVSRPNTRFVRIGVVDRSRTVPEMRKSGSDGLALDGRGLVLVDALADRWGTDLYRWGKQVWGELRCMPTE